MLAAQPGLWPADQRLFLCYTGDECKDPLLNHVGDPQTDYWRFLGIQFSRFVAIPGSNEVGVSAKELGRLRESAVAVNRNLGTYPLKPSQAKIQDVIQVCCSISSLCSQTDEDTMIHGARCQVSSMRG